MSAENRRVIGSARLVEGLDQSLDLRRHDEQVANRLAPPCVAIRVGRSFARQDGTAGPDLAYLGADPEPKETVEHVPSLIVGVMDVQRRNPFVLRLARVRPLDDYEIAL